MHESRPPEEPAPARAAPKWARARAGPPPEPAAPAAEPGTAEVLRDLAQAILAHEQELRRLQACLERLEHRVLRLETGEP